MRKLKNKYLAWSLLGALTGFLYAFLDDMEFAAAEAHRGKAYKPDPDTWAVWTVFGGAVGVPLALLPRALRGMKRHPVLTLAGFLLIGTRAVFDGVDGVERRLSTTSLGESPSLQPGTRPAYPLPAAADDTMGIGESQ